MANERNNDLPDISGIFEISDDRIPAKLIDKPKDTTYKNTESVLFPDRRPAQKKRERAPSVLTQRQSAREEHQAVKRISPEAAKRAAQKRKQLLKQRAILLGIAVVLLIALIAGVAMAISASNRPQVVTVPATRTSFSDTYEAPAIIYTETTAQGEARTYAVFVDNRYDRETSPLKPGLSAVIELPDGESVTGRLAYIRPNEESTSEIVTLLVSLLPGADYEPSSNTVIMVHLDNADAAPENAAVKVKITVNEQENVVMLPLRLVQDPTGEPYVWTYKSFGKKLVKTNVTLGPAANGNVVISEGLSAGTPVVWEGDFTVFADGMKVKAEEREQAPDAAPASTAAAE